MEIHTNPQDDMNEWMKEHDRRSKRGKIAGGILLVIMGSLIMAREMGAIIPNWITSWPMIVTTIGVLFAARRGFKPGPWIFVILVGAFGFVSRFNPELHLSNYFWPAVIIFAGIMMIFKPRSDRFRQRRWKRHFKYEAHQYANYQESIKSDERLEIVSIFGGAKKNVLTKNFQGGEVVCVFGGAEVNFNQADFNGTIELEVVQVFGGAKLLIPAHWTVHSEVTSIFGSVEDNRPMGNTPPDTTKVVLLKGTCLFGGIELVSY